LAAPRRHDFGMLRFRSPENEYVADALHRRAIEGGADFRQQRVARVALDALELDLDQRMGLQRAVDLFQHRGRKPLAGDGDGRIQVVRCGAQRPAFGGG